MSLGKGGSPTGATKTTQTSDPWSGQIPYLTGKGDTPGILPEAANLFKNYDPQYFPGQTLADPTAAQTAGINAQISAASQPSSVQNSATNSINSILDPSFLAQNPSLQGYANAAGGALNISGQPYQSVLNSGGNSAASGLAQAQLASLYPSLSNIGTLAGAGTLNDFANGSMLSADNPYFKQMADRVMSEVQPGIDARFNNGNRLDSGLASRALGLGLGDAVGSLAYDNYQQGLQQQQQAATTLSGLGQQGRGQQLQAADSLGNLGNQGTSNLLQAAGGLTNVGAQNQNAMLSGLGGLNQGYQGAANNQIQALTQAPNISLFPFQNAEMLQQAGQTQQGLNQASIDDAVQRYNYYQQLPYEQLQAYADMVNGNYGGTSTLKQPYYQNQAASGLNTALTGASLFSSLFPETAAAAVALL